MLGERNKTIETAKAAREKSEEARVARMAPAGKILETLRGTTQKSLSGRLKSWFVGNSKEYNAAYKALEGVANGTGDRSRIDSISQRSRSPRQSRNWIGSPSDGGAERRKWADPRAGEGGETANNGNRLSKKNRAEGNYGIPGLY